jgi:hypothetical protein
MPWVLAYKPAAAPAASQRSGPTKWAMCASCASPVVAIFEQVSIHAEGDGRGGAEIIEAAFGKTFTE